MEAVILDYEGEPCYFEDGRLLEYLAPYNEYGEPADYYDFEAGEWVWEERDRCDNDREAYGLGWYDCNTDWRTWR